MEREGTESVRLGELVREPAEDRVPVRGALRGDDAGGAGGGAARGQCGQPGRERGDADGALAVALRDQMAHQVLRATRNE